LKAIDSGGKIKFQQQHQLVLIGTGPKPEHVKFLEHPVAGEIEVKREKIIRKGELLCKGGEGRAEVEKILRAISKKEVRWV